MVNKQIFFKELFNSERCASFQDDFYSGNYLFPFVAKYLFLPFNKIWDGNFPDEWSSTSIVYISKKGDLSYCNNCNISLINVGIKIMSPLKEF
jgi:hypothetical protein